MKVTKFLMLVGGLGCWVILAIGISVGPFGFFRYQFNTLSVSNVLLVFSFTFAVIGSIAFFIFLKQNKLLSISILGGVLAAGFLSAVFAFLLKRVLEVGFSF